MLLVLFLCTGAYAADFYAFPSVTWEADDRGVPFLNHYYHESGNWTATCDIPSFGAFDLPLSTVTYTSELISWTWPEFGLSVTIYPDDTFTTASHAVLVEAGTTSYNLTYYRYVQVNRTWEADDRGVPFLCHFVQQPNGTWTAVMDLPSFNVIGMPVDNVIYTADLVSFHLSAFNSSVYAFPDATQNMSVANGYIIETDGSRYNFTYFRLRPLSANTNTSEPAATVVPQVNSTTDLWAGHFSAGTVNIQCFFWVDNPYTTDQVGYFMVPAVFGSQAFLANDLVYTMSRIYFWDDSTEVYTSYFELARSGSTADGSITEGPRVTPIFLQLQREGSTPPPATFDGNFVVDQFQIKPEKCSNCEPFCIVWVLNPTDLAPPLTLCAISSIGRIVVYSLFALLIGREFLKIWQKAHRLPGSVKTACLAVALIFALRGVAQGVARLAHLHCQGPVAYFSFDFLVGFFGQPVRFVLYSLLGVWWINLASNDLKRMGRILHGRAGYALMALNVFIFVMWIGAWSTTVASSQTTGQLATFMIITRAFMLFVEFVLALFFFVSGINMIRSLKQSDALKGKASRDWRADAIRRTSHHILVSSFAILFKMIMAIPHFLYYDISHEILTARADLAVYCEWSYLGFDEIPSVIMLAAVIYPFFGEAKKQKTAGESTTSTKSASTSSVDSDSSASTSVDSTELSAVAS